MSKIPQSPPDDEYKPPVSPAVTNFPSPLIKDRYALSEEEKMIRIAEHFQGIMEVLGLDISNQSLKDTPYRIAKMYVKEIFSGLDEANFPTISFFQEDFQQESKGNIVFLKVGFTSFCEHHFVPMVGFAYIAYIPDKRVIGLSKIHRIVRFFAQRPQIQERLTAQIADSLALLLDTENVAVSINARHYCVMARGIQDEHNHTITNVLRGDFGTKEILRREFLESINRQDLS